MARSEGIEKGGCAALFYPPYIQPQPVIPMRPPAGGQAARDLVDQ